MLLGGIKVLAPSLFLSILMARQNLMKLLEQNAHRLAPALPLCHMTFFFFISLRFSVSVPVVYLEV